ncbi:DUF6968 family protein [Pedosphaera parvula]|uniref:DUF6968 domain-containing protein n=1 Tax=Pedosphaera parvula (strain Ellin514) TaxID=320771 RepID=B9XHV2_PEDPL|nr:hypothetical protein [Pedosphaera parvula]EEF60680.1 hypothetical protein Cflav_PD6271 [Pedosphaera parvula Ellin514]
MAPELNSTNDIIARRELNGVPLSGEKFQIIIEIGKPYTEENQNWRCPVTVQPLSKRTYHINGSDSFQALTLAISFAHEELADFVKSGGKLFFRDSDEEFNLNEPFEKQ